MENIYTARMEAIEEDNSLEADTQLEENSTIQNVQLVETEHLNRFEMNGIPGNEDMINEYEGQTYGKTIEKRPSAIKIDKTVDELVNQILSPDTAEFINFEKQMKEMSQKKTLPDISSEVDEVEEKFIQKTYHDTKAAIERPALGRTLSSSSSSTTFSVSDLTQLTSSEYGKPIEQKRSMSSMELQEQQSLERMALQNELETKLEERKRSLNSSLSSRDSDSGSVISGANDKCDDKSDPLHLMAQRQFRSFNRADEYLYAMKEDLAEWLNMLYTDIDIDAENFLDKLETGEILVKHANCLRCKVVELLDQIAEGLTQQKAPTFTVPDKNLPLRSDVQPGTWFARDNVYNFIKFCKLVGVMECIMFETEDLVCRKNEKHVVLTLLEVARRGAKIGMLAPMLVQFEQEIDREIAREERERRKEEKEEERRQRKEEERRRKQQQLEQERQERLQRELAEREQQLLLLQQHQANNFDSMQVELGDLDVLRLADVSDADLMPDCIIEDTEEEDEFEEEEEEEEPEDEDYAMPIGPLPQMIFNDLKSLDEMVRELVSECQCPTQFPMIRVSEGKYRIGDTQVLIFVRILRNHVMVRVGGGWDTLQHYLDKHDPCRCRAGHRSSTGAALHHGRAGSKNPMNVNVCYDRSDSPATVAQRRRSSTQNINQFGISSRRSASLTPNSAARTLSNDCASGSGSNSSTPRGSLSNINSIRGRSASINSTNLKHQNSPALKTAILNNSRFSNGNENYNSANTLSNSATNNKRPLYSPLVSRRGTAPIVEMVVDTTKSQNHKEISKSTSLQTTNQCGGKTSSEGSSKIQQLQKSPSSAIPMLHNGVASKPGTALTSKSSCDHTVNASSNTSISANGREAFLCDSSSEVSDEGYKSSQGGCSSGFLINKDKLAVESGREFKEKTSMSKDSSSPNSSSADIAMSTSSHEDRPLSSLTVASECSSTISSEEEEHKNVEIKNAMEVTIERNGHSPPPPPLPQIMDINNDLTLVNQMDLPPPPISPTNSSISGDGDTWQTPTNKRSITDDPELKGNEILNQEEIKLNKVSDKNSNGGNGRLGRFFNSINKKFKTKDSDKAGHMLDSDKKSSNEVEKKSLENDDNSKYTPRNSINGDLNERPSSRQSIGSIDRPKRCRSASGDNESITMNNSFSRSVTERRSYRGPAATSRYMQAAEAYTAKSRNARVVETANKSSNRSVWTGLSSRGREGSSNSGFTWNDSQRPYSRTGMSTPGGSRPASRTASASPGPCRRQQRTPNGQISRGNSSNALRYESSHQLQPPPQSYKAFPTSTHSTPCKKPQPKTSQTSTSGVKKSSISSKSNQALAELEADDDLILKRMEEILLTYKSKVEDHLAAEGRELPKEIFEDFTSQWVQNVRQKPEKVAVADTGDLLDKNVHASDSADIKSKSNGCLPVVISSSSIRTTPVMRKDKKEGIEKTRIPMPTYFNSPIPTETDI